MNGAAFVVVFLACAVEAVEATTIVLVAGTVRDWRSAVAGLFAALVTLAVLVVAVGPALSGVPLRPLRLIVGGLLLVFGLQWLRKAILRASGFQALHDESAIYQREVASAMTAQPHARVIVRDWYAFTLSYKGVFLEGLEVVFIVLTFGANDHDLGLASVAAGAAILVVAAVGLAVRGPLAKVPENAMKFVVGVILTGFGTFWGAEGAGARWPGSDGALPVVVAAAGGLAFVGVVVMRQVHERVAPAAARP